MPSCELGASAAKKYDIESLLPASDVWAELSSASNCTDYQSRRLDAKLVEDQETTQFVHTVCLGHCVIVWD